MLLVINNQLESIHLQLIYRKEIIDTKKKKIDFGAGEKLLLLVSKFLNDNHVKPDNLKGIAINKGPGSYTSLRIAALFANAWAYRLKIPIFSAANLKKSYKYILPDYGAKPKITKPKKNVKPSHQ